jgi:prepilin-type N-terminal cleavage/methylation domain-containing protein
MRNIHQLYKAGRAGQARRLRAHERGFTLLEVLTVISIAAIMSYLLVPSLVSLNQAGNLKANASQVGDILEQAYSAALSKNTYVWVGFSQVTANGGGVAMASVYSAHENPGDYPNAVMPLTKSVFLHNLNLATISAAPIPSRATTSVGQITGATLGTFSAQISGSPQTLSYVIEITPSGQVFLSSTNKYAWMEIGLKPANGNGQDVSVLQMNAFTGRVSTYQP